jgi:hypothetical protein
MCREIEERRLLEAAEEDLHDLETWAPSLGAASAFAEECETCGEAADYGESHCPRCRKLWELANVGGPRAAQAFQRLHELALAAAD